MLDTNILFSCMLYSNEQTHRFLLLLDNEKIILPMCVIKELYDVVARKRNDKLNHIEEFLNTISYTLIPTPENYKGIPNIRDEKDKPILAAAIFSNVDYLITGDKDFLVLDIKKPKILTMQEFIEENSC